MEDRIFQQSKRKSRTINRDGLIHYISHNKVNFVAYVITPFHVIGIKAFLKLLRRKGYQELNGIIVIGEHVKNGYILDIKDIEVEKFCNVNIYYYKNSKSNKKETLRIFFENIFWKKEKEKKSEPLFIIHQAVPWVYFSTQCIRETNYNVINVITDDGLSSYFGSIHWAKMTARDNDSILYGIRYIIQRGVADIVRRYYFIKIINFSFFSKERLFDKEIVSLYKQTLENEKGECGIKETEKYILYLGQPCEYPEKMWKIVDEVLLYFQNKGYKIYIKSHPREKEYNYNTKISVTYLTKKFSVESIIAHTKNKPSFVIGWISSSLLTLSVFWNIKCYTLCNYLPLRYQGNTAIDFISIINSPLLKNKYVDKLIIPNMK